MTNEGKGKYGGGRVGTRILGSSRVPDDHVKIKVSSGSYLMDRPAYSPAGPDMRLESQTLAPPSTSTKFDTKQTSFY